MSVFDVCAISPYLATKRNYGNCALSAGPKLIMYCKNRIVGHSLQQWIKGILMETSFHSPNINCPVHQPELISAQTSRKPAYDLAFSASEQYLYLEI